jgi:hypothetical protein
MISRIATGTLLSVSLLVGCGTAGESLKSGPAVGQGIPGVFHPLNVTGNFAGQKQCLV